MRSFFEVHPELVKEWSPENDLTPDKVSYGSNKGIIWNGSCGHSWTGTPKNRHNGHGCPVCSGNLIVSGVNDLKTRFPKIAREWSPKNYPSRPKEFGPKSNKEFWWKCSSCGREWLARIADRTDGHGCPHCLKDAVQDRKIARIDAHKLQVKQACRNRQIARSLKTEEFQKKSLLYYAENCGAEIRFNFDYGIGIPVQLYFPEKCAAIELTSYMKEGWADWRRENAKNWLCLHTDTQMVRIIPRGMKRFKNCMFVRLRSNTAEEFSRVLNLAFKKLEITVNIDISRDYEKIRRIKI